MDKDTQIRMAAFEHIRKLIDLHDHLAMNELNPGFTFEGERIPFHNRQRGIFKPKQMQFLLSIKTVYPRPGGRIWYDDQRTVLRQIYEGDEVIEYAFMGKNPQAADNRWLLEALEKQIPVIYFLGIAPSLYKALLPVFIVGWDPKSLRKGTNRIWNARPKCTDTALKFSGTKVCFTY